MSDTLPSAAAYRPPRLHGGAWSPETKRRLLFAGGIVVVIGLAASITPLIGGLGGGGAVPVIEADPRPVRSKPENPGGLQLSSIRPEEMETAGKAAGPVAPEMPDAGALRTYKPPEAIETPGAITPRARTHRQAEAYEAPATLATPPSTKLATNTAPNQQPVVPQPATKQPSAASPPNNTRQSQNLAGSAAAATPPARAGKAAAQLAALRSETAAHAEWESLRRRVPDLLGTRQPSFQKTERDGQTLWRVRAGGFADLAEARAFCEKLRARGVTCLPAES